MVSATAAGHTDADSPETSGFTEADGKVIEQMRARLSTPESESSKT
jgi:putative methionine-R-sulfoxide reductase with GAF domain